MCTEIRRSKDEQNVLPQSTQNMQNSNDNKEKFFPRVQRTLWFTRF